jgi:hypothetical protein
MPDSKLKLALLSLVALCLLVAGPATASDRDAVERAVLDYVEGVEQGKPELIERGVHIHLAKFGFGRNREGDYKIYPMTFDELVELAANMKKEGHVPENPTHNVEIFEVLDKTAAIKLTAFWGVDYMHLAKYDGEWKIVQVLWQSHPPE